MSPETNIMVKDALQNSSNSHRILSHEPLISKIFECLLDSIINFKILSVPIFGFRLLRNNS